MFVLFPSRDFIYSPTNFKLEGCSPDFACLARLRGWCVIRIRAFALLLFRRRLSTCFQDLHLTFFAANVVADHDVIKEEW